MFNFVEILLLVFHSVEDISVDWSRHAATSCRWICPTDHFLHFLGRSGSFQLGWVSGDRLCYHGWSTVNSNIINGVYY